MNNEQGNRTHGYLQAPRPKAPAMAVATVEGLGDKAAEAVVDAAAKGRFLSKDDFRDRTKVSKTVIDLMDDMDLFGDIPQSNQMSLFDFTG